MPESERSPSASRVFGDAPPASCAYRYSGLMFQPRLLAAIVLLAILLQSAAMCLVLAGILWWNVLVPQRNPFDALYNRTIAAPRNLPPLTPAPAPRRFAQGMAGAILGGAGLALLAGWPRLAWILEGLVVVALGALSAGAVLPRLVSLSSPARRDQFRQPYSPVESRGVRARDSIRRESQPSRRQPPTPRMQPTGRRGAGLRSGRRLLECSKKRRFVRVPA